MRKLTLFLTSVIALQGVFSLYPRQSYAEELIALKSYLQELESHKRAAKRASELKSQREIIKKQLRKNSLHCLARNMYFEAYNQGEEGMLAVGYVTLNRAYHWGDGETNLCKIVYEKYQFSWTQGKKNSKIPKDEWVIAVEMASLAISTQFYFDNTRGSTNFVRCDIDKRRIPWWNKVERTVRIGDHCFGVINKKSD